MLFLFFKCVGLCTTGIDHGTQRTRSEVSHTYTHAHTHTHKRAREIFFFLSLSHSLPYLSLTTAFIFKHFTIKFKKKKNFQSVCIEAHVPRISPPVIPHHSDHCSPLHSPLFLSLYMRINNVPFLFRTVRLHLFTQHHHTPSPSLIRQQMELHFSF